MKKVGVPETPLRSAQSTSSATRAGAGVLAQVVREPLDVEAELARRSATRSRGRERVLVVEQQVVHLPERSLLGGRLGRLGRELRARVDVGQRQVAPDVADVAEVGEQLADDRLGPAAVRALEVAVLDDASPARPRARACGRARGRPSTYEVDDRLAPCRAARGCAAAAAAAPSRGRAATSRRDAPSAALRTPSFASSSWTPWNASVAISSETVKPMPAIVPPPATAAQPTGGRSRPRLSRVTSQALPDDPDRLADDVADEDPERDRRAERRGRGSRRRSRCPRSRARTAARSRSSSTGGRAAAAARSARSPTCSPTPAPSARARASAARGTRGRARSPARGRSAAPGRRR